MTLTELLAQHQRGDAASLQSLASVLAATLQAPAPMPDDPVGLLDACDTASFDQAGTWQEVRAARDYGRISPAEYDYLAAAVEALTPEDPP